MPRRRSARSRGKPADNFANGHVLPEEFTCTYDSESGRFRLAPTGPDLDDFLLREVQKHLPSADEVFLAQSGPADAEVHDDPTEFDGKKAENGEGDRPRNWSCQYKYRGETIVFRLSEMVWVDYVDDSGEPTRVMAFLPPRPRRAVS